MSANKLADADERPGPPATTGRIFKAGAENLGGEKAPVFFSFPKAFLQLVQHGGALKFVFHPGRVEQAFQALSVWLYSLREPWQNQRALILAILGVARWD